MASVITRVALLVTAISGLAALVTAVEWAPIVSEITPVTVRREVRAAPPAPASLDSMTRVATAAAVFRERRSLASVAFDPSQPQGEQAPPPPPGPPKPAPQLVGIAWGGTPVALLDGIPGHDGSRAMQRGDTAGGLKLRRITPHEVTMTGYDTTWTLRIREFQ